MRKERQITLEGQGGAYSALGYQTVRTAAKMNRTATAGAGAHHDRVHRPQLINQSRDFMRNNSIYSGMMKKAVDYMVANGFGQRARTSNASWNQAHNKLWQEEWVDGSPEVKGILSGRDCERQIMEENLVCGDVGIILTEEDRIQIIEAEQIAGKGTSAGFFKKKSGRPSTWLVSPYGGHGQVQTARAQKYQPGSEFLFQGYPGRPSAVRGVPPSQAAFSMMHRISDVCDSEAVAWQLLSRMAVSITREAGPKIAQRESKPDDKKSAAGKEGDLATRVSEVGFALFFHGNPGDKIEGIDRNIPGKDFSASLTMFLRLLGLPIGLPLEIILMDWTHSNFAQAKGVLEQVFRSFLAHQYRQRRTMKNIRNWFTDIWISQGRLADRSDKYDHTWGLPSFPWFDRLKEAQSYGIQIDRCFVSHADVCRTLEKDRIEVVEDSEKEITDAIRRSQRIEKATGVQVGWETFAGRKSEKQAEQGRPGGIPAKLDKKPPTTEPKEKDKKGAKDE